MYTKNTGQKEDNGKRGFTLIELLVVIAIIGMLASIVLASLDSARKKGRDARRVADIRQIQLALELYYDGNGGYPQGIYSFSPALGTQYISVVPKDPNGLACAGDELSPATTYGTNGCYHYVALGTPSASGNCPSYHLWTVLEVPNSPILASSVKTTGNTVCHTGVIDKSINPSTQNIYNVTP